MEESLGKLQEFTLHDSGDKTQLLRFDLLLLCGLESQHLSGESVPLQEGLNSSDSSCCFHVESLNTKAVATV